MKWTLTILILLLLLLLSPMSGQETKVTIQQQGELSWIGCTNGGHLHLTGDVRVAAVAPICTDSSCKETSPDKLTTGAHVPPGQMLGVYCTTKAEDEQANRDMEFCKNNHSVVRLHALQTNLPFLWSARLSHPDDLKLCVDAV